nr:helix-turn-helix transcriptional regulator [uncultured Dyadobacter sp.]
MIRIVEKGRSETELKVSEESILTVLSDLSNSRSIHADLEDAHVLVAALRRFSGKTGEEVGGLVGIKQEAISAYENGRRIMNLNALNSLISALGYKVSICVEKEGGEGSKTSLDLMPNELSYSFIERLKNK